MSAVSPSAGQNETREAQSIQILRDLIAAARATRYGVITMRIPIAEFILQEPQGEMTLQLRPPRPGRN